MYKRIVFLVGCIFMLPFGALAQGDPLLDLLQNMPSGAPAPAADPAIAPCPRGRECVTISSFTKADYKGEARKFQVGQFTEGRSFDRLVVHVGDLQPGPEAPRGQVGVPGLRPCRDPRDRYFFRPRARSGADCSA